MPVFPRSKTDWKVYSHALDRDVILQKDNSLERIDLQLIAMISEARSILKKMGYKVEDKIILSGFSASGTFANRFSMIHPEKIGAVIAGGVNGLLMLPYKKINDRIIEYPIGIGDFELLFGKEFDSAAFAELPQFLFMGENDDNDAVPYEDAFSNDERELIFELLGKKMQPERWNECRNLYKKKNLNADIITYSGIGHEHPEKIKEDILRFVENSEADK